MVLNALGGKDPLLIHRQRQLIVCVGGGLSVEQNGDEVIALAREMMEYVGARFLTAQWLNLAVLNFDIDPRVLAPFVPAGTELDKFDGCTLASVVGFEFRDTRVWGLPIPFHRSFAEVNLRFYVRRRVPGGWRRGVSFVKELAPRRAVAWVARRFFGENYSTVPMRHRFEIDSVDRASAAARRASYTWRYAGTEHCLAVSASGLARYPAEGSEESFVIEQCWGYSKGAGGATTKGADRRTLEYRVEHPRWQLRPAGNARFEADVARLYGSQFAESLAAPPRSAYLVDGSSVTVFRGVPVSQLLRPSKPFRTLRSH